MKTALPLFLAVLIDMLASSSFARPVIVIHAIKNPFKSKLEKVLTKPIPNKKFGEICIYDTARCDNEVEGLKDRPDSSSLFIAS